MIALRSLLIGVNLSLCLFSCYAFQPLSLSSTNGRSKMFSRRNEEQRLKNGIIGNDDDSGNNNENDIVDTRIERRSFVESTLLASSSLVAASLLSPVIAFAEDEETTSTSIMSSSSSSSSSGDSDELIDVYFGCGCVSFSISNIFQPINIISVSAYRIRIFSCKYDVFFFLPLLQLKFLSSVLHVVFDILYQI